MAQNYKQSFKSALPAGCGLSVYNCGQQSCEGGYTWGPGVRDHYLIHLVTRGCGTYSAAGNGHPVEANQMFLSRPGQLITYTADTKAPWKYAWVGFNGSDAEALIKQLPFTDENPVQPCKEPQQAESILQDIFEARGMEAWDQTAMTGHLYLFLSCLARQTHAGAARAQNLGTQYVENALRFIRHNYSGDISVDDISKAVGVSRSHLYRIFMSELGQSPIDYLTEFRIAEARRLLETTDLAVSEVAYSVGFADQFYFSRVFKKTMGMPPSRYIESLR